MKSQPLTLADGAETVIEWFGEPSARTKGVIAFFPALGVSIRYYRKFAEVLSAQGYCVAALETRGQAQSSVQDVKRHNFGYKEVLTQDMAAAMEEIGRQTRGLPLYLAGHSLGGQFALLYASRFKPDLAGIALVAAGSNYYRTLPGAKRSVPRHINIRLTRVINNTLGFFPGDKLGFGGRQPLNMMNDWSFEGLNGFYDIRGDDFDYNQALAKLEAPVLMLSLDGDPLVPKSCADFLAAKLKAAEVSQQTLPGEIFGNSKARHFRWAKRSEPVVEALDGWLTRYSPKAAVPVSAVPVREV